MKAEGPNRHLIVQSQQWKSQNSVRNLLKISNKDGKDVNKLVKNLAYQ